MVTVRSRRLGARLALAFAGLAVAGAVALTLLECGLRVHGVWQVRRARARLGAELDDTGHWAVYDEDLIYRLNPGFGRVNEQGLLGDPVGPKTDRLRALILGDSLGFYGDAPGDTYVALLDSILVADPSLEPIELLNASVPGYTNYQELVFLRKYGLAFEPDLVGVGVVLNDLHRFLHSFVIEDGRIVGSEYAFTQEAERSVRSPLFRLVRRSRALLWLKDRITLLGAVAELMSGGGYTFEYRPDFAPAWSPEAWAPIEQQLGEMVELGRAHGFSVFVYLFPYAQQLRRDYLERAPDYVLQPQRRLLEICQRLEIPFLDLTPHLSRDLHFASDDVHLTREGREEAARRIAEFLVSSGLLPGAAPRMPAE